MKKTLLLFASVLFLSTTVFCQSIDEGLRMMQYQKYLSASWVFEKLVAADPNNFTAAYWLGIAEIRKKETDKAITYFKNALNKVNTPLLTAGLANAYAAAGNKIESKNILLKIPVTSSIANEELYAALGRVSFSLGDYVKAEDYYNKAILINKNNLGTYILLGNNFIKKGDGTSAFNYFNKAIQLDSTYAPAYFSLAKIFLSQKDAEMYLPYLIKTLEKDSLFTPAWYEMYRYAYYHDKANVKRYYTRYLELSDKTELQQYQLLVLDFNDKKYKSVLDKAKILMKDEDSELPVEIYKYVGFSYFQLSNLSEAFKYITQYMQVQDSAKISKYDIYLAAQVAARIKEKDSMAIRYIVNAYESDTIGNNRKLYATALINYYINIKDSYNIALWSEKLLPYKGINKIDLYRIGVAWYNVDDLQKADSIFKEFVKLFPYEYKGIYMQAGIEAKKDTGTTGSAVPYFETFIAKVSGSTKSEYKPMLEQSYTYLGGFYLNLKQYDMALSNYELLLKSKPGDAEVKKTIAGIKKYLKELKIYKTAKNKQVKGT